ncbi:MAG: peptidase domain-containing ABC transporter [Bacteroidales bacterium]|nr:peptidase domain-containing ABC transporter [Bacteroidales bacterium]
MASFPFYKQLDAMDCGPSCLRMIAKFYGKSYSLHTLREKSYLSRDGVSMMGISEAAESIGFRTMGVSLTPEKLFSTAPLPLVVHWKQNHFVVVYKVARDTVFVADPAFGLVKYTKTEFLKNWISVQQDGEKKGLALLLETTPDFYAEEGEVVDKSSFRFLLSYLKPHRKYIVQLILGMLLGSMLQLLFPFLTQSIVDVGINNNDINFIYLILIAQLVLFISRMSVDFIRGWILLHLSTRMNISLISDFLIKLMKLPLGFFDIKLIGDILQRIGDHRRIEHFLTTSSLNIIFSLFNLVIFGIVLAIYSWKILLLFIFGSFLYFLWLSIFMRKRRELDFKRFSKLADNQSKLIQLIYGVQDIKLFHAERQKRWEWENIQGSLFKVNIKSLALTQYQEAGGVFINETKNILITFLAATSVIHGDMTLGMMLAVSYILGQLNSPIEQMINFMHVTQDAKISMERLGEIHKEENEEKEDLGEMIIMPESKTLEIRNLSFQYEGPHSRKVLDGVNLKIPADSVTAIVGVSGSGKTTLVKLLLTFYPPVEGEIRVGDTTLQSLSQQIWRRRCGVVMQDGYIFADTIARNISLGEEYVDPDRLLEAVKMANIKEYIESLPVGYNTKLGTGGQSLSGGEKQRILIARAIYKQPEFLFIDEGTSSLDAENEKVIIDNLQDFFRGRTVVVVAHRLSTVKNANQIVVLDKGKIAEIGKHNELIAKKGKYYELVKNQLELGSE